MYGAVNDNHTIQIQYFLTFLYIQVQYSTVKLQSAILLILTIIRNEDRKFTKRLLMFTDCPTVSLQKMLYI